MNSEIYLIRHAQAAGNLERRFQGRTDTALTDTGRLQAAALAARFADVPLTAVYTSPLARARDTAAPLAAPHGLRPIVRDGLVEIDGGDFENRPFTELEREFPELFRQFLHEPHKFPGAGAGESMLAVHDRMKRELNHIACENPGGVVAVVSHGAAIRASLSFLAGWPFTRLGEIAWGLNTCVAKIIFNAALLPDLAYYADVGHLPAELLPPVPMPAKV